MIRRFLPNGSTRLQTLALIMTMAGSWMILKQQQAREPARSRPATEGRGRAAEVPEAIPARGLKDVLWRVVREVSNDRVMLIAAGVTFYLLLATFPALAALVSLYGLVADPHTMADHLNIMASLLPPGSFDILADQVRSLAKSRDSALGLAFFTGLIVALWSTRNGVLAIFDAMNIAYDEEEKRSLIRLNLIGLGFTLCAIVGVVALIGVVAVLPVILSYVWLDRIHEQLLLILRWPVLIALAFCAIMIIYRYGPSRTPARLRWLTWGAALTALAWVAMSIGFSFYLGHFADYNATYGALGALIGLLVWTWLSVGILIVGAELNAELEHQTAKDTTTGLPRPMGTRGAYVADTIGEAADGN